jgi:hypothetical protein
MKFFKIIITTIYYNNILLDANLFFDLEANKVTQFGASKTSPAHQQFYFNTIISNELMTARICGFGVLFPTLGL